MSDPKNDRDLELDLWLDDLRKPAPSELDLARWKKSVSQEHRRFRFSSWGWVSQMVAALLIGFIAGAWMYGKNSESFTAWNEKSEPSATLEIIYTKPE